MSRAMHVAKHIERTVTGPMWHGPALAEVLEGVTSDRAAARPIGSAHSIWEIVLHVIAWAEIARGRVNGERLGDPAPEQDWPPVAATSAGDWTRTLSRLDASHRQLADEVRRLDVTRLDEKIAGLDYSVGVLLHGVIEHGTYHGGQIALLKKA
jgi:uncharacterized damage-inducible protein DinB